LKLAFGHPFLGGVLNVDDRCPFWLKSKTPGSIYILIRRSSVFVE